MAHVYIKKLFENKISEDTLLFLIKLYKILIVFINDRIMSGRYKNIHSIYEWNIPSSIFEQVKIIISNKNFKYSFDLKLLKTDNNYILALLEIIFMKLYQPSSNNFQISIEDLKKVILNDPDLKFFFGYTLI